MSLLSKFRDYVEHHDDSELWMLPFATLMLTLVILFIALYAFSLSNSVEYETAITDLGSTDGVEDERAKKEIALAKNLDHELSKSGMRDQAQVLISARHIKIKLESPILFDSGSAELKPGILPLFRALNAELNQMENPIVVEGHTDNIAIAGGRYRSNWELSAARAFSVIYFFIQNGIDPGRVVAHGFGEYRPAFTNDTEAGRARNRRIEITILRESE